jgi:hypothetical protein
MLSSVRNLPTSISVRSAASAIRTFHPLLITNSPHDLLCVSSLVILLIIKDIVILTCLSTGSSFLGMQVLPMVLRHLPHCRVRLMTSHSWCLLAPLPYCHVRPPTPLLHYHVRPSAPLPHCHVRPLTPPRHHSPHPCGLPSSRLGPRHSRCMPGIFTMSSSDDILLLRPQHPRHLQCPLLPVRGRGLLAAQLFHPVLLFLRCPKGQSRCLLSSISIA